MPTLKEQARLVGKSSTNGINVNNNFHICEICGLVCKKAAHLEAHSRTHTGERPFACPKSGCELRYKRQDHLSRHLLVHEGHLYECRVASCPVKCTNFSNLQRHLKRHQEHQKRAAEGRPFRANGVRSIRTPGVEVQHVVEHRCPEETCGKIFKYKSLLETHAAKHAPKQSETVCTVCWETFGSASEAEVHRKEAHLHVNCPQCGKRYARDGLRKHMKIHEPDRMLFVCDMEGCGKQYTRSQNLEQHIRAVHLQQRPFLCSHPGCGRSFAIKSAVYRHENNVHTLPPENVSAADKLMRERAQRGGQKRKRIERLQDLLPLLEQQDLDNSHADEETSDMGSGLGAEGPVLFSETGTQLTIPLALPCRLDDELLAIDADSSPIPMEALQVPRNYLSLPTDFEADSTPFLALSKLQTSSAPRAKLPQQPVELHEQQPGGVALSAPGPEHNDVSLYSISESSSKEI